MSILRPKQSDELPLQKYIECFNLYVVATGVGKDYKAEFIDGLSLDNQKEVIRFGIKKPLTEIMEYLERHSDPERYAFGEIVQGNDPVRLFYAKLKKYNAILNLDKERLKYNFIRGLNPENQLEVDRLEGDLPLEELVERLAMIEDINKYQARYLH